MSDDAVEPASASATGKLAQLRHELLALRNEVGAGALAPVAVTDKLDRLAEAVQDLLIELARTSDGQDGFARSEAAAALAELLTPREREVARAVLTHGTSALAAHALDMSQSTLGHHRSNILRKLGVNSFAQVAFLLGPDTN
ncbi:LuxR C-terminal-related transcriptional regulator [uncultured Sphingomonas sp.]|uniref:helix-turn-helix transcriptional regulator n=1 Tax=uncultured Sphingomonas sp. TaxID=158754 RepID=UPI0035C9E3E8